MKYGRKIVELLLIPVVIVSLIGVTFVSAEAKGIPFGDIWEAIFGLRTRVDNHDAEIAELQSKIADLEDTIETLEGQLETHTHDYSEITSTPNITALALTRKPDYDSGWVGIDRYSSRKFNHGLGLDVMVYVYGRSIWEPIFTSQHSYGSDVWWEIQEGLYIINGFYWINSGQYLTVTRNEDIWGAGCGLEEFRVLIWKLD